MVFLAFSTGSGLNVVVDETLVRSVCARRVGARVMRRMSLEDGAGSGMSSGRNVESPVGSEQSSRSSEDLGMEMPSALEGFDSIALAKKASEIVDDVKSRPEYYLQVAAVLGGSVVTITILQAIIGALEKIPVIPDVMELVSRRAGTLRHGHPEWRRYYQPSIAL
mmetsp:Transcript_9510/g.19465  ORF Transcript_9510/g.19465 Transcript_9510/m.19465 type:complete len:165 (-) Transcript_9510:244-738(-)